MIAAGVRAPARRRRRAALAAARCATSGKISYAWYLWHWPCLVFARTAHWAPPDGRIGWRGDRDRRRDLARARGRDARPRRGAGPARALVRGRPPAGRAARRVAGDRSRSLALGIDRRPARRSPGRASRLIGNADASAVPAAATPLEAQASTAYARAARLPRRLRRDGAGERLRVRRRAGAKRTVVLIGDSHAAQWFPALERLGVARALPADRVDEVRLPARPGRPHLPAGDRPRLHRVPRLAAACPTRLCARCRARR